jgi:hypothetical protein
MKFRQGRRVPLAMLSTNHAGVTTFIRENSRILAAVNADVIMCVLTETCKWSDIAT